VNSPPSEPIALPPTKGLLSVGRPFGIEIGLHLSWVVIAILLLLSLAGRLAESHPDWSADVVWLTASVIAVVFLVAIVFHEVAHAIVARLQGQRVRKVALVAMGGAAEIEGDASDAVAEIWMSLVGPLVNLLSGGACLLAAKGWGWAPFAEPATPLLTVLVWTGYMNVALGLFSLVPAFPMDGGLVLRALLWRIDNDALRATRRTARVGEIVALGFIGLGVCWFFFGAAFEGLWVAVVGWFLWSTAAASHRAAALAERLRGVTVGDVMRRDSFAVDARTNLEDLAGQCFVLSGGPCFVVWEGGSFAGVVTLDDMTEVPRRRWPYTTVDEVMQPPGRLLTVAPSALASDSLDMMGRHGLAQLPVLEGGRLLGVVSRGRILRLLRDRPGALEAGWRPGDVPPVVPPRLRDRSFGCTEETRRGAERPSR
jgi:Zn-dependent protease